MEFNEIPLHSGTTIREMKNLALLLIVLAFGPLCIAQQQEYYELRVYHFKTDAQEDILDGYLQKAYLPALREAGIKNVGVFSTLQADTADRKIIVLTPYKNLAEVEKTAKKIETSKSLQQNGKDYINAIHNQPPYERYETILLKAFSHQPLLTVPQLKGPRENRIYELRSYEGHTEKIFKNKVHMFNEGGEIALFKKLGFNAVFYGEVLAGSRMPNLMYMTTFENKESRDEHWKQFGEAPEWIKLKSMPEYQNNVSKIDITFLTPKEYSDY
jgi:hypothetical protein